MNNTYLSEELIIAAGQHSEKGEYWLDKMSGEPARVVFPYDRETESGTDQRRWETRTVRFPEELRAALEKISRNSEPRLHMILTAALAVQLRKYSGEEDVVLGTTIYKQQQEGRYTNTVLPLRIRMNESQTFKELLLTVRETVVEANENQEYPVEVLVDKLELSGENQKFPLFGVAIILNNIHERRYLEPYNQDMILTYQVSATAVEARLEYDPERYDAATADRILRHQTRLLEIAANDLDTPIAALDPLSAEENRQLLEEFGAATQKVPPMKEAFIHRQFEEQVKQTPEATALVHGQKEITYRELNEAANRLAHHLKSRGIGPNDIVGVLLENPYDTATAILGILKAGAAYLPVSADLPVERVLAYLNDSRASQIITANQTLERFSCTQLQGLSAIGVKPFRTVPRPTIKDLNNLPIPDRSLVNYEKYNRYLGIAKSANCMSLQATRGCPYKCAYCHKIWPKTHVNRTAEHILQEMQIYYDIGVRKFSLLDDIFNLRQKNSITFFEEIIKRKMDVELYFPNGVRADLMTPDYVDLMVEAGTVNIALALETASPRLQKLIGKNMQLDKLKDIADYICAKHPQVVTDLFTMHGFPSETEEEAMMTLNFIKSLRWIHYPWLWILKVYPKTDMEKLALENGVSPKDIARSENLLYHQLPYTLPWNHEFTKRYQSEFLHEYLLLKERLLHVLPYQMEIFSEREVVMQYAGIVPDVKNFDDILKVGNITREELRIKECRDENESIVPEINTKLQACFPKEERNPDALRILLLDLSLIFIENTDVFDNVFEPPLGLMYLMSTLEKDYGPKVNGKILKSQIDFENFDSLKEQVDEFKPQVIGMRTLTCYNDFLHRTVAMLRQWGYDVPVIAGGPYATSSYESILQDRHIDLVVLGEGEITFSDLVGRIMETGKLPPEQELKDIPGIAYIPRKNDKIRQLGREIMLMDAGKGWDTRHPSQNPVIQGSPSDPAYIIYTSGSTGTPKGVVVEHEGVARMLEARKREYNPPPHHAALQLFSYVFDGYVTSFFTPLISGGKVVLLDDSAMGDLDKIKDAIVANSVSHMVCIPEFFKMILRHLTPEQAESLKIVALAGEKLPAQQLRQALEKNKDLEIVNEYGVTEASVLSTLNRNQQEDDRIRIGRPVGDNTVYILDSRNKLQPIGVSGELCISGKSVARGYLNNPQLTAEKFIDNPYAEGQRLYKTGDRARWQPDGAIEHQGRIDHQVKLRGFRIELQEIENRLQQHEWIKDSVVEVLSDGKGNNSLAAYIIPETEHPELWPSVSEFFVYDELLYYAMTNDELRNRSYKNAINRHVKDKVVLEVGTGRDAILARFCAEAGAARVYAVELLEESYKKAKETVARLGLTDKIFLLHGDATTVVLPEKVDVVVSEIVGAIGGSEGAAVILNSVRQWMKEDGLMIPGKSITQIAAVTLPGDIHKHPVFAATAKNYVEKIFQQIGKPFDLRLCIKNFPQRDVISDRQDFENLDFSAPVPPEATHTVNLTITKNARIDGFLVWLNLYPTDDEKIDILEDQYCWLPVFVPVFYPGVHVTVGDGIRLEITRSLDKNGINPDFKLKGRLTRNGREDIDIDYDMLHFEPNYRTTPFYQKVFSPENYEADDTGATRHINPEELKKALKQHLAQQLPPYMQPVHYVQMEEFPFTATGKLDRKALRQMDITGKRTYIAPQTEEEERLAAVWEEILGIEKVSTADNFFDLGGDSIKALQISAQLQNYGMTLENKNVFNYPTIGELAHFVTKSGAVISREAVEGDVKLTPVQKMFIRNRPGEIHHFNQAIMCYREEGFDLEIVKQVMTEIVKHHDALRMVFAIDGDGVRQQNRGIDEKRYGKLYDLEEFDWTGNPEPGELIEREAARIQGTIDLAEGPLVKMGYFKTGKGDHLLLVIHHLVVDGVSWRIILEDFVNGYRQKENGEDIEFPAKTHSFRDWAEGLAEVADSPRMQEEQEYWRNLDLSNVPPVPRDNPQPGKKSTIKDLTTVMLDLDEKETEALMKDVNRAYNTEINDILLTALGLGLHRWSGNGKFAVNLEGHGREDIVEGIDIARTVGFFTTAYPLVMEIDGTVDLGRQIAGVKERLRGVPDKGIGYGILKYLTSPEKKPGLDLDRVPEIGFNYLGQYGEKESGGLFRLSDYSKGETIHPDFENPFAIDIKGMQIGGRLRLSFGYDGRQYEEQTVIRLVEGIKASLQEIIRHCTSKDTSEFTPSDVTGGELDYDDLDSIRDQISDI